MPPSLRPNDACPCGSGRKFKKCCGPVIDGVPASSPDALMRSRFSAYAGILSLRGATDHLFRTTHPENPAVAGLTADQFRAGLLEYARETQYTRLEVHHATPPDKNGIARVAFTATFVAHGRTGSHREHSTFVQQNGRWVYLGEE